MVDMPGVDHAPGAARRRRERRLRALRQFLRHERLSVAMALAEASHHTAPRGQRIARAREEERETKCTAAFRTTVPPPEPELFDLFEEPGGRRPNLLLEPQGPQLGVQRHTVLHIVDILPYVQILDVPVPQLGGRELVEFMQKHDTVTPEQVIEVPKLSLDSIPQRSTVRRPQTAEQLVDVPTKPVYVAMVLLRRILSGQGSTASGSEQIVDIAVPQGGGGLQSLRPGHNSTALGGAVRVDIPVPSGRGGRVGWGGL